MTRSDQQPKAVLPCPDPECGGVVDLLANGAMGARCRSCGRRSSTATYAQALAAQSAELAQVRQGLEGATNVAHEQNE